ncbi:hypothetical protein [Luteitalea sp.]|jgi:hypothetical protein|uniref:hypothetical protein n=1 Tax=Luteitalea sp. TaxID=2004800 RepID=UPI0025C6307D|nr:hypothetical protein [Luteitalea sp.]
MRHLSRTPGPRGAGQFIVCAALLCAGALHAAQAPPALPPPDASTPDLRYAASLVAAERPVGVVLMDDELYVAPRAMWPYLAPDATRTTSATVSEDDGFTLIESQRASVCRAAVARAVRPMRLTGTILEIPYPLVRQDAQAKPPVPPGSLGGGGSRPSPRSRERLDQLFDVEVRAGDTLSDALTRIVREGVPFGWGVVERAGEGTRCQLIWITEDTVSWTSYDLLDLGR